MGFKLGLERHCGDQYAIVFVRLIYAKVILIFYAFSIGLTHVNKLKFKFKFLDKCTNVPILK